MRAKPFYLTVHIYRRTDGQGDSSIPPNFVEGGIISINSIFCLQCFDFMIPIQGTVAFYIHERPIYVSDFMCKMPHCDRHICGVLFLRDDHSREYGKN